MKSLVVANWKMNPATAREARKLFEGTKKAAERARKSIVVVVPPSIFLRELASGYRGKKVFFAVQNAHAQEGGAYTGEISFAQAKDSGVEYAIIGHAERREMGETNDDTSKKVAAALAIKMTPILCVGEKARTKSGEHFEIVREQLRVGLASIAPSNMNRVVIAYEPLWVIGDSKTMRPHDMHEMAIFVRKTVVDLCGASGHSIKILYGGSIDDTNVVAMLKGGDVRGFLVGRASLNAKEFSTLLQAIENA